MLTLSGLWFRTAASVLLGLLLFSCSRPDGSSQDSKPADLIKSANTIFLPSPAFAQPGNSLLPDVATESVNKVVNIYSERVIKATGESPFSPFFNDPFFKRFFGKQFQHAVPKEQMQQSLGSGVIIDASGTIVTNEHVIDKADEIQVVLNNKNKYAVEVLGRDSESDLAVLRLKGNVPKLQSFTFGDSSKMRVGDIVLAIGNPFGVGNTVTMGIISAKGRANLGIVDYEDFIQTDAAINPGNSGGALVNTLGQIIGLNTAILSRSGGYQGIGFAIPSNMVKSISDILIKHGKVVRGWLGVGIQNINQNLAKALDLPGTEGVLISDVTSDSPAKKAGLKRGDVIVKMDNNPMTSSTELRNQVAIAGPDKKVKLEIIRDGKRETVEVTLGKLPNQQQASTPLQEEQGVLGGLTVESLTSGNRATYHVPDEVKQGVVVTDVGMGSSAQFAGFQKGDVILDINHHPVKSVKDLKTIYDQTKGPIAFLIERDGNTIYLGVGKK